MVEKIKELLKNAKNSSQSICNIPSKQKNHFLSELQKALKNNSKRIISENKNDLLNAKKNKLDEAFIDRLKISEKTVKSMIDGLQNIEALNDPIGNINSLKVMSNGLQVGKMRVPLGVILMIYESRPNVTIDAAALAVKSGNSIILRGGSEAINSNLILGKLIKDSLSKAKIDINVVQVVDNPDRSIVKELIQAKDFIDVIIPRGGKGLIQNISDNAKIPVIKHLDGNCHIYVDEYASLEMAIQVVDNAKTQRYGTCNTLESLVVNKSIAKSFLPKIFKLFRKKDVEMRGCSETLKILTSIKRASTQDFYEEYLAPIISIKIVPTLDSAINFINKHSSGHTESIITENFTHSQKFIKLIDSSSVMINASTRFADGFEYGLGAEVGISTDKFHARGPVGLEGLTSEKYIVLGSGQIRN